VSPDGELVAQVGSDFNNKEFGVWDASTARVLFTRPHADLVAWSPDSTSLAVSLGKSVEILDRSGEVVRTIDLGFTPHEMIFTADGRLMAAGRYNVDHCEDSPVIWGEGRSETFEIPVCATQVVLDPTGRKIATLGGPRPQIWDAESGELLLTLPADFGHGMVFSPDGSTIADATGATVRLSDANTGEQKLLLRGHGCAVQELAFSADGSMLASATRCDGARVWVLDIDRLLEVARQNVTRSLTDAECRQYLHLETCPN
jgi:WD40 repeat protein